MKKDDLKRIFYQSLTGFASLALAILLFFCMRYFDQIRGTLSWLMGVLTPFVYGGVLAYLLKTPCNFLEVRIREKLPEKAKRFAHASTVLLVMILTIFVIYFLLSIVLPEMVNSIVTLVKVVPRELDRFSRWLIKELEGNEVAQNYVSTGMANIEKKLQDWAGNDLLPTLQGVMGGFANAVGSVLGIVKDVVIGVIICIYLLLGRKTFARQGKALIYAAFRPDWADKILEEIDFIDKTFVGFFGGKILDSAIVGLICYVFCLIMTFTMNFKNAVLISVIIGVTNIIPYFGPFIGAIPSALLILINSPVNCVIFIIFVVILQQFDGNILGPRLLANSVGLTGFWVLFSITLFQGLLGFVGILIGVPVFAVIYDLVRRMIRRGLRSHGREDLLEMEETSDLTEDAAEEPVQTAFEGDDGRGKPGSDADMAESQTESGNEG